MLVAHYCTMEKDRFYYLKKIIFRIAFKVT